MAEASARRAGDAAVLAAPALDERVLASTAAEDQATPTAATESGQALPTARGLASALSDDERIVVDDALALGASVLELTAVIARIRGVESELNAIPLDAVLAVAEEQRSGDEPEAEFAQRNLPNLVPLLEDIAERERVYLERLRDEFGGFPAHVQRALSDTAPLNGVASGEESYRFVRERLWRDGWPAAAIYANIASPEQARLAGQVIDRGAHAELVRRLEEADLAGPIQGIGKLGYIQGFQPRRQEKSEKLSNHSWALAFDIAAEWNPVIHDDLVKEIILRRSGLDLNQPLIDPEVSFEAAYATLVAASQRLRDWLADNLPVDTELRRVEADAVARVKAANAGVLKAKTPAQQQAARAELDQARQALDDARNALRASSVAQEIGPLRAYFKDAGVERMAWSGFVTLPHELVARLRAAGFRWGGADWERSTTKRDYMHFELDPGEALGGLRAVPGRD